MLRFGWRPYLFSDASETPLRANGLHLTFLNVFKTCFFVVDLGVLLHEFLPITCPR